MTPNNPLKAAKDTIDLVGEVMKAAGENPDVRAAGGELGKTALTITKTINNALLPLAAINFAFDKARKYFSERFAADLEAKVVGVPADQIEEPKASLAGPALQGLAFAHEEPPLRDMYLSLLASAMDKRASSQVHPSFVELIRQLDAQEARLLKEILAEPYIPIAELRLSTGPNEWEVLLRNVLPVREGPTPIEVPRLSAMVDNWTRLGLVEVLYDKKLAGDSPYGWVESRPELLRLRSEYQGQEGSVTYKRGILGRTAFGEQFARAVGILT